ncbi:MAG: M15 family metallopeptidase [Clostridia bacterium]|nr:M15 family metallopeptidase [Clostridia bacterium]
MNQPNNMRGQRQAPPGRQNTGYQQRSGSARPGQSAPKPRSGIRTGSGTPSGIHRSQNAGPRRQNSFPSPTVTRRQSYAHRVRRKQRNAVTGIAVFLIIMIMVSLLLLVVRDINWDVVFSDKNHAPFQNKENIVYGPDLTPEERDAYVTQYVTVSAEDVYRGHCILVNLEHEYHFREDEVGTEIFSVYKNKTGSYKVNSGKELLHIDTIHALNDMMDGFYAATGSRDIMLNSAYRTYEGQQNTYDYYERERGHEYAEAYVQKPGFSEHHTGYACDFAVYQEYEDGSSAMWSFDGKDQYFWIDRNGSQYGFILRYSASKEDITGISYESWHYRYVGIGNALAITTMGVSLEEYVTNTKSYSYDGDRYYVRADDGKEYAIYYVPANGKAEQQIPIPSTAIDYDISGNNVDGFIIAVQIGTGHALQN